MAIHLVYRFYAELADYKPKIWRRFEVNGNKTMAELGYILMTMFEMQASHLFCLTFNPGAEILEGTRKHCSDEVLDKLRGKSDFADLLKVWRFELPFEDIYVSENEEWYDASECRLKEITNRVRCQLKFIYDYGDNWQVNLSLESCEKVDVNASELPKILEGEGFGIIEDCGGVTGLEELTQAFKRKMGGQYDEYRRWLGVDDLDLAAFDIDDVNFRLKKLPRIYKETYEYGYEPTQRSIDLIERRYKNKRL
jgi:hypothetical protein